MLASRLIVFYIKSVTSSKTIFSYYYYYYYYYGLGKINSAGCIDIVRVVPYYYYYYYNAIHYIMFYCRFGYVLCLQSVTINTHKSIYIYTHTHILIQTIYIHALSCVLSIAFNPEHTETSQQRFRPTTTFVMIRYYSNTTHVYIYIYI